MQRYRYSSHRTKFGKYAPFVYFFGTWNLLGYVIYKVVSKNTEKKYPDYEKLSSSQKAMIWLGYGKDDVRLRRVVVQGLTVKEDREISGTELVALKKPGDCNTDESSSSRMSAPTIKNSIDDD